MRSHIIGVALLVAALGPFSAHAEDDLKARLNRLDVEVGRQSETIRQLQETIDALKQSPESTPSSHANAGNVTGLFGGSLMTNPYISVVLDAKWYGSNLKSGALDARGIPPSAAHVKDLIERIKADKPDGILTTGFYGKRESETIAQKTGVRVVTLPADIGAAPETGDWFSFMDQVLASLK